jgi:hypothetical protein
VTPSALRRTTVAAAAAAALLAGGCSHSPSSSASDVVHFPKDTSGPRTVRVGLVEWSITTSKHSVPPGAVRLRVTNAGGTVHDLEVQGVLGDWETPDLSPGEHAVLTVRGRAGETLRMWCTEPGHAADGMRTTLAVR